MKTNYHNKIYVLTDLHDTLIHSKSAWIRAFKEYCGKNSEIYKLIKNNYDTVWKRKVCEENNVNYEDIKTIYLKYITRKNAVIKLVKNCNLPVILVSNGRLYRVLDDIKIIPDVKFEKIYSRDDGVKPDLDYMQRILDENNIDYAIMLGNDKIKDVFSIEKIKTILVSNKPYFILKREFDKLLRSINV